MWLQIYTYYLPTYFKRTIPLCSKLSFAPKLYVKRFSTFYRSRWSLVSKKYRVAYKESKLKDKIKLSFFLTQFSFCCSDTFVAHEFCSDFAIQNTFMSTILLIDEVIDVTGPVPINIRN